MRPRLGGSSGIPTAAATAHLPAYRRTRYSLRRFVKRIDPARAASAPVNHSRPVGTCSSPRTSHLIRSG